MNTTTTVVPAVIVIVMTVALWPLARRRPGLPPEAEADLQEPASTHARPIGVPVTYPVDVITDVIALALDRRSVTGYAQRHALNRPSAPARRGALMPEVIFEINRDLT